MEEKKKDKIKLRDAFKNLKYTLKYSKNARKYLIIILFANIVLTALSIIVPILNAKKVVSLTDGDWNELISIVILIFIFEISVNFARFIYSFAWNRYFYAVKRNIQLALVEETLKITNDEINKNSSGVFIERINNDTDKISDIVVEISEHISEIIGSLGMFVGIYFINKIIFLLYLSFLLILFFFERKTANINIENRRAHIKNREKVNGFTSELVRGSKDIKILNAEKSFLKKTSEIIDDLKKSGLKWSSDRAKFRLFNGNIRDILDLLISLWGINFVMKGELSIASLLIIYNYTPRIMSISRVLESLLDCINSFNLSSSRVFGILIENEFEKEKFGNVHVKSLKGDITFKNVCFNYDDKNDVLKNMSFIIEKNKTVAFVGKSGAGKSTIFNLISKLYSVDSGNIYLDEYDIESLDKDSIRANLSIISQNPYIYNMSIRENLQIIKNDAKEKDIIKACKMACLHDFIMSLDKGYDTVVGEGGVTLSGGEKQRLAIARAFLLNTKIILFDEATSALDNETQSEITKAIQNMRGEFTVIIIAHRLSTVIDADKIFVVDKGKIVDSGTHEELLKNSRMFRKLYNNELKINK